MITLSPFLAAFLGGQELLIILVIILILFGGAKLPALARGLGQSMKEFKKAAKEEDEPAEAKPAEAKKTSGPGDSQG
jgi:sec-independent protein translocase protein TatA